MISGDRLHSPSLLNRLTARRRSELPTTQLEAFRRAGAGVFDVCLLAEQRRRDLLAAGQHPWDADGATASLFLCAWNAKVHHTLAVELLDSDAREDPRTAGFVPSATYRQVWTLFQPVQAWLSAARRAAASSDFWIGDEAELPTPLADLHRIRQVPRKHLKGLLVAGDALDQLLEQELGAVTSAGSVPDRFTGAMQRIAELLAHSQSSLHYAQGLWHPDVSAELEAIILNHLFPALVLEHHLGQFLALPELVDQYRNSGAVSERPRRHGFRPSL